MLNLYLSKKSLKYIEYPLENYQIALFRIGYLCKELFLELNSIKLNRDYALD